MNLRKKMAHGAFWSFLEKGGQQITAFIVFTIIARLIGPEEYGLVALCGLFVPIAANIVSGLTDAVISIRIKDDERLSTLFWFVNLCGVGIGVLSYLLASPLATVMHDERIIPLFQCFSVIPPLLALASVPTALVTATMNFRVFTIRTLVASFISGIVGIVMAVKGYGAYAIITQHITLNAVINLIVWPSCGWRPRFVFNLDSMSETLRLGFKQTGSSLVASIEQQIPRFVLGAFASPLAVGEYTFVLRICAAFQDILIQPLMTVVYPAFALIRDDAREQKKVLDQIIVIFGSFIFPTAALAIATTPVFLPLLFGDKWTDTTPLLQLMLISSAVLCMNLIMRDLLRAHKFIGAYFRMQTFIVFASIILSALLVHQGLYVFMAVSVAASGIGFVCYAILVKRKTHISLWPSFVRLWAPVLASVGLFFSTNLFMQSMLRPANPYLLMVEYIFIGGITYTTIYAALQWQQIKSLFSFIRNLRRKPAAEEMPVIPQDL